MRIVFPICAFIALFPAQGFGFSAAEYSANCSGNPPFKSPSQAYLDQHLNPNDPCPHQSHVDEAKECSDAFKVAQSTYKLALENRKKTCAAALKAKNEADKCKGAASCINAQQSALSIYQAALKEEITSLKSYSDQLKLSMRHAVDDIAGGELGTLKNLNTDLSSNPDSSGKYGPTGRGQVASVLKSPSNQAARDKYFHGEDEAKAQAALDKFKENEKSDISGIKSPLIREPLLVARAGQSLVKDLDTYQQKLQASNKEIESQTAKLKSDEDKLKSIGNGNDKSDISSPLERTADATKAAAAAAPPAEGGAGGGSPSAGAGDPAAASQLAAGATAPTPHSNGTGASTAAGNADSSGAPSPGGSGKLDAVKLAGDPGGSGPSASFGSNPSLSFGDASMRGSSGASAALGAAQRNASAKVKSGGGGGASIGGGGGLPPSEAARAPASQGGPTEGTSAAGSLGSFDASGFAALDPGPASETNEKAVQGIVADWSKALSPDEAAESATVSASEATNSITEGTSLFLRVRSTHDRAMRRGMVLRGIPVPL